MSAELPQFPFAFLSADAHRLRAELCSPRHFGSAVPVPEPSRSLAVAGMDERTPPPLWGYAGAAPALLVPGAAAGARLVQAGIPYAPAAQGCRLLKA